MAALPELAHLSLRDSSEQNYFDYSCPFCGREQVITRRNLDFGALKLSLHQCLSCKEVRLDATPMMSAGGLGGTTARGPATTLIPLERARPALPFQFVPQPIIRAYHDACYLAGVHTGAAGAYARRALELLLDGMGYQAKTILDSIEKAKTETDFDKRLPKRMIVRLDYIKEIGNFALHVRRDRELAIIDIEPAEVEACLETVEELLKFVFEDPGLEYQRAVDLKAKLIEASKKPLTLPDQPGIQWDQAAAEAPLEAE